MLIRQLEYLSALAREGHFGRAAEACHVSQPALSAGIRKLEAELGVQIVRRGQRLDGFTPEGEHVLRWGQRMLAERESLDQTLSSMRAGLDGVLRIGVIPTSMSVCPLIAARMREQHPMVRFSVQSMSSREIARRLNEFEIDVGMTYVDGEPLGRVRVVPLYREQYYFLTPDESDLPQRDSITWAEAALFPLCLLAPVMQNRRVLDGIFAEAGAEANAVVETDTISGIYSHVASMRLSSVIPHTWLHSFGVPGEMHVVPLPRPKRSHHVGLVLAGSGPETLLASALVDTACQMTVDHELDEAMNLRDSSTWTVARHLG
ncbi:MAG: LysR family transcriptional regulator [Actinomycetia bacterium]|nr:LysR family transcriptional regulator [Actinomycetes bacterium]